MATQNGTEVTKTFLEHIQTLFEKDELYFFGWFGIVVVILLICVCCVGCRACCCRACCFARETRTQLYMCKLPQKGVPFFKRGAIKHQPRALPCHHPHHCTLDIEIDPCTCNHCSHCKVQPCTEAKVDKATNTGPSRVGFEYVHSSSAPSAGWRRPEPSSGAVRNNSTSSQKGRAPDPPGFRQSKYPPGSWSYHKPNAPPSSAVDEAVKTSPTACSGNSNITSTKPIISFDDEAWD